LPSSDVMRSRIAEYRGRLSSGHSIVAAMLRQIVFFYFNLARVGK
jgi:hypothetical protein